ncbi:MAG: M20/M25/M40 family metallo-hydrolase [Phycisphaeraceae bacterium]|nr:M20/M25/M40 family metallo-hydrolase [Phycisphaeraceae bacterium]
MNVDLLKRLCETPGVPGREERVRALIEREIDGLFDEVTTDPMGNLICKRLPRAGKRRASGKGRSGRPTRVSMLCHMDQIGFYVRGVDERGFIRVVPAGGFDTRNLFSRRVLVCTGGGDLPAVMNPGGRPVHIASEEDKKKIPDVKELIVDTGMPGAEVKKRVKIGDYVVYNDPFMEMGGKVVSQALDNRIACWLGIESVRKIEDAGAGHACELYVVFTTQEEVGLRGAKTSSHVVACDIGIGLDVTLSCDTPGVPEDEAVTVQGKGFGLHVMDSSFIADHRLVDEIEAIAKKHKIAHQRTILMRGGQDGAAAQQSGGGARAVGVVVGTRYIHTTTEMADKGDLAAARDVLAAWVPTIG